MNPWTRDKTRDWINKVESRLDDFDYYIKRSTEWCENNGVFDTQKILMCNLITCIWVASMRNEQITFQELVELMGLSSTDDIQADKVYEVCEIFQNLDHEEILQILVTKTSDPDNPYITL